MFVFSIISNILQILKKFCNLMNGQGNDTKMQPTPIRDIEPSTSHPARNVYHMNVSLYVLDVVRLFQDHPKYANGLQETHIVSLLAKEDFACGDIEAQVRMALKDLTSSGFVRLVQQGYRTLGPYAKLALARTPRQFNAAWDRLCEMQKASCTTLQTVCNTRNPV